MAPERLMLLSCALCVCQLGVPCPRGAGKMHKPPRPSWPVRDSVTVGNDGLGACEILAGRRPQSGHSHHNEFGHFLDEAYLQLIRLLLGDFFFLQ